MTEHQVHWSRIALREDIDQTANGSVSLWSKRYGRSPVTIYRWLRGASPIPMAMKEILQPSFKILDRLESTTPQEATENETGNSTD
jgi:hypothetical protein